MKIEQCVGFFVGPFIVAGILFLRLFLRIEFVYIDASRIGHLLIWPEVAYNSGVVHRRSLGKSGLSIWAYEGIVCNKFVLQMLRRRRSLLRVPGAARIETIVKNQVATNLEVRGTNDIKGVDFHDVLFATPPTLTLSNFEKISGQGLLRAKLPYFSSPWICVANRDEAYLDNVYPGGDWHYHSYRNSRIQNYVLAVESLIDLGYFVFRMGRSVSHELPFSHPRFLDYATSDLMSDFLDVYLGFGCTFFLSTGSGVEDFAGVARRPRCYVNYLPLGAFRIEEPRSIHVSKSHRDALTNRVLTQSEIVERGAHGMTYADHYEESEILLDENSPDQIRDVVLEMHELVTGTYAQTSGDKINQEQFWSKYPLKDLRAPGVPVRTLIGRQFLRDNPQWLQ